MNPVEAGVITTVLNGIAKISGLPGVGFDELVRLPENIYGIAFNIDPDEIGVVLLGDYSKLQAGGKAERTGRVMDVPVGDALIGRVIDPLGRPLDGRGPLNQGMVGSFNDQLADLVTHMLEELSGRSMILAVGERIQSRLTDAGNEAEKLFAVPGSVDAIIPLVGDILTEVEKLREKTPMIELYLFYNSPVSGENYHSLSKRLLPLDVAWEEDIRHTVVWPTKALPEMLCGRDIVQLALIREYLFVSLFRACAESLASENASQLSAMQRAEKNIDDMLEELFHLYNSRRQSGIDEELFDVVSGFNALSDRRYS